MSDLRAAATLLSVLASADRLELLSFVVRANENCDDCTASAAAAATGRDTRSVMRDAARLMECGLLRIDGSGMTARLASLREAADHIDSTFPVAALLAGEPDLARLFSHGQLVAVPDNPALRLRLARLLARLLPAERSLSEAEVNRLLGAVHPDFAATRRLLVDCGLVTRGAGHDYRRFDEG